MKKQHIHTILFVFLFFQTSVWTQETINALDASTFILGGGQESSTAIMDLQPIAIIDLEPDPDTGLFSNTNDLEAGNPFLGTGSPATADFWLNYTYRSLNLENGRIFVSCNQPLPGDMTITLQIINTAMVNGSFNPNPNINPINLSTTDKIIVYDFAGGYTGDGEGTGYLIQYNITNHSALSLPPGFEIVFEIK